MGPFILLAFLCTTVQAQPTPGDARRVFSTATRIAAEDNARLWGISLAGPLVLVDRETRFAISNTPAPGFDFVGDVWTGTLPHTIAIANTAFRFGSVYRTMLLWPAPEGDADLRRLLAHELWHRVQREIGFPMSGPANEHLGTRDGRYLLQLEMRALAKALRAPNDPQPLADALGFRDERFELFPTARAEERPLLMHEGLGQYTGARLAGVSAQEAREHAARALAGSEAETSFVRSFAYALGPAYGLLLDVRRPGWTRTAAPETDLRDLFDMSSADPDPDSYGGQVLAATEDSLESARLARMDTLTERYVTGRVLFLKFDNMNVSFDPGQVEILAGQGSIYQSMTLTDTWGKLTVTGGALIKSDWSGVVVPAPRSEDGRVVTDGYELTLDLAWQIACESGSCQVRPSN